MCQKAVSATDCCNNACADDEYKALVDKYQTVKTVFEKKMLESCRVSCLCLFSRLCYTSAFWRFFFFFLQITSLHLNVRFQASFMCVVIFFSTTCFWLLFCLFVFFVVFFGGRKNARHWAAYKWPLAERTGRGSLLNCPCVPQIMQLVEELNCQEIT